LCFIKKPVFTVRSCLHLTQTPSSRTTPCHLSTTAYSIYPQLPSLLEVFLPSATCHALVTGTHSSRMQCPHMHEILFIQFKVPQHFSIFPQNWLDINFMTTQTVRCGPTVASKEPSLTLNDFYWDWTNGNIDQRMPRDI